MKKAARAVIAVAVGAAAVMMSCRRPPEQAPDAPPRTEPTAQRPLESRLPPFSPAFVQRMRSMLRQGGVEVFSDESVFARGDAEPTGFAVSEFQLRNMAVEASADTDGGIYGTEIDRFAPMPQGAPPMSFFIAAWVSKASTPAAKSAAALMGPHNWRNARSTLFPTAVLAAFVGDAVRAAAEETSTTARVPLERFYNYLGNVFVPGAAVFAQSTAGNTCNAITSFFRNLMTTVFNALKIKTTNGGVVGFFADLWNGAVELARTVIGGLLTILNEEIVDRLQGAVAIVGIVATISSVIRPWALRVRAEPYLNYYAVGNQAAPTGRVTARIDDNGFPGWPAGLEQCARNFGVTVPTADVEVGVPVHWEAASVLTEKHIRRTFRDETLPASKTPRLEYVVKGRETEEDARAGKEIADSFKIAVSFERAAITQLKQMLVTLIKNTIPGLVGVVVKPAIAQLTNAALEGLLKSIHARGSGVLTIRYHGIVRCGLFTLTEANQTLHEEYTVVAQLDQEGCAAGTPGGGNVSYSYIDLTCRQLGATLVTVGITPLPLGPGSFYRKLSDRHVVTFPSRSRPSQCIQLHRQPADGTDVKDLIRLARMMIPKS